MKTYLLIFNSLFGTRQKTIEILNNISTISHIWSDMPHAILLKSSSDANKLCDDIRAKNPHGRFFVCEISSNRQGYLPNDTWTFIKGKTND